MTSFMASGHLKLNKKSLSKTKSMFGEPLQKKSVQSWTRLGYLLGFFSSDSTPTFKVL